MSDIAPEEAFQFMAESMKLALFSLEKRLTRLEDAFLKTFPLAVLPEIPESQEEKDLIAWARERDLLEGEVSDPERR